MPASGRRIVAGAARLHAEQVFAGVALEQRPLAALALQQVGRQRHLAARHVRAQALAHAPGARARAFPSYLFASLWFFHLLRGASGASSAAGWRRRGRPMRHARAQALAHEPGTTLARPALAVTKWAQQARACAARVPSERALTVAVPPSSWRRAGAPRRRQLGRRGRSINAEQRARTAGVLYAEQRAATARVL